MFQGQEHLIAAESCQRTRQRFYRPRSTQLHADLLRGANQGHILESQDGPRRRNSHPNDMFAWPPGALNTQPLLNCIKRLPPSDRRDVDYSVSSCTCPRLQSLYLPAPCGSTSSCSSPPSWPLRLANTPAHAQPPHVAPRESHAHGAISACHIQTSTPPSVKVAPVATVEACWDGRIWFC